MEAKFLITLEDGTQHASHDDEWNSIKDHAHFLAPHNNQKWMKYKLEGTNGTTVEVDFITGIFRINDSTVIHPAGLQENVLTEKDGEQDFPVTKEWQVLNGLPYFPVVGRRTFKGQDVNMTLYFCGWKKRFGNRTIQKMVFILPNGDVVLN